MSLGTVSFEELLGHCNEVYKTNQKYNKDRMKTFGYVPEMELDNDDDDDSEFLSPKIGSKRLEFSCGSVSAARSNEKKLEEELFFQELQEAVVKLNNYICKKEGATECSAINQDDLESLALGHKGRCNLPLLLRMKQLVVEDC